MLRDLEDVIETLRNAKKRKTSCSILIGAGCSVTAGIPTANDIVDKIKQDYPRSYRRAKQKTYASCMAVLSTNERRFLISDYVDRAKINWAHIALAQLIKCGYIDRVLTTNFDSLIIQACALLGEFPAIYDLATSSVFDASKVHDKAVFYLHGQRTGFIQLHTQDDFDEYFDNLAPVFEDACSNRVWIVIGYSGENDPVFNHLSKVQKFNNKLYWIGYKDNEPALHVRENLLVQGKDAYFVKGYDADSFLVTLAQELDCFPPDFISKPFTYLDTLLDLMTPFVFPDITDPINIVGNARKYIRKAIDEYEEMQKDELNAWSNLVNREHEKVIALRSKYQDKNPDINNAVAWAYILEGNEFSVKAEATKPGEAADQLYKLAAERFESALEIDPNKHEALLNWGTSITNHARTKEGYEADQLFQLAYEKFENAIKIKPDKHEAYNNWGNALDEKARKKTGKDAIQLIELAEEKYKAALKIKPDKFESLNNLGNVLLEQANLKTGDEAEKLFVEAYEMFAAAIKLSPNNPDTLSNWGNTLADHARTKNDEEADKLFNLAFEKYNNALQIKPDLHQALFGWANALADQARKKKGAEADRLFQEANNKYEAAIKIKPDYFDAYNNWGGDLIDQGRQKRGKEAFHFFELAKEKLEHAIKIHPDYFGAFYNLGRLFSLQALISNEKEMDELFDLAREKFKTALKLNPNMYQAINDWGNTYVDQSQFKSGVEVDRLINLSIEKFQEALKINPNYHHALNNWGTSLGAKARRSNNHEERDKLYRLAENKFQAAIQIKSNYHEALRNWGSLLVEQANTEEPAEAEKLFELAKEKYKKAVEINPNYFEAYNSLGAALIQQSQINFDKEEKLLSEANKFLKKAESISPGSGSYNLACTYALQGKENECHKWLVNGQKQNTLPPRDVLENDTDFASVRTKSWFKNFIKNI